MAKKEMKKEYNVDSRKYRKSTHLASADIEYIILEGNKPILTIKEAYYAENVEVSGKLTDCYVCEFVENFKPMVLNSTNREIISGFAKANGIKPPLHYNTASWSGIKIELYVDYNSKKVGGGTTSGIRIKPIQPKIEVKEKPIFTSNFFLKAYEAGGTIESISKSWTITEDVKKEYIKFCLDKEVE